MSTFAPQFRWDEVEPPNYCPNCGAKVLMEREKE
jgi:DNA-directed RNA polymerase subunit RPC12/RpoP